MKPTPTMDALRERLRQRAGPTEQGDDVLNTTFRRVDTTPKPEVKATEAKAKEKPMPSRHTRNNTGLKDYTNSQLGAKLDSSTTQADIDYCVKEFQNRLSKYRETLGHIGVEVLDRLEVEYQKYHDDNGFGQYEHDEDPEPSPPPPPSASLTWEVYLAIESGIASYGPYILEIYESDWDYVDRRPNNVRMRADEYTAKDFADTHKKDIGTIKSLSERQVGIMMVLLKAYLYHKTHPEMQAAARNAPF
jgi:hypothetical protein